MVFLNRTGFLLIFTALAGAPALAQHDAEEYAPVKGDSVLCPDPKAFGENQKMLYRVRIEGLLERLKILSQEQKIPFQDPPEMQGIRILTSEDDSAVCQKLNERFSDALSRQRYIGGDYDGMYPAVQPIYFAYGSFYFAYLTYYTPEPPPGEMPLLSTGRGSPLFVFDCNLNEVFEFSG